MWLAKYLRQNNDATHQMCCLLGEEARKYADKSGNPIGKVSDAFYNYYGFIQIKNFLVHMYRFESCTFYSNKFDDGTHIKYINGKVLTQDENKYSTITHKTLGIPY